MKILVFEYITGGGFNKQELPDSLASEGRLMLQALLDNFRSYAERSSLYTMFRNSSYPPGSGYPAPWMVSLNHPWSLDSGNPPANPRFALPDRGRLCRNDVHLIDLCIKMSAEHGNESGIELVVMLDSRVNGSINTTGFDTVIIRPEQNSHEEFARLALHCDAVWPIAPEFDGILQTLCQTVELSGKSLLTSPASAVAITGSKWNTYQHLKQHHIATVPTRMFTRAAWISDAQQLAQELNPTRKVEQWLVKPVDGVGCADSYILTDRHDFEQMRSRKGQYVIQPHIQGKKTSLSCLFKQGSGWLLCVNLQHNNIINQQYHLSKIIVNHHPDLSAYQDLVDNIAHALPELWGYVGIDLIETPEHIFVLEINPRLTTSFVGINAALGINVAENVLQLLQGEPTLKAVCNQPITVKVRQ
jgi:predicted ATP-grasp superfamily ATP-dependent carboligase